jgi:hypothetical protein
MAKVALLPLLLAAGRIISGVYGALHDQISYTVSPDYFHHLKFCQFNIADHLHNRLELVQGQHRAFHRAGEQEKTATLLMAWPSCSCWAHPSEMPMPLFSRCRFWTTP